MDKQKELIQNIVDQFKKEVNQLIDQRTDWQENQFKSSNELLYDLLSKVYDLYLLSKGGGEAEEIKRKWIVRQCEERKIAFKSKKPTLIQLITKLVFFDSLADSRRVNSYARVLNAAAQSPKVLVADDIPKFIRDSGGIEEVRAATSKNTKSPTARAEIGRCILDDKDTVESITIKSVKNNAASVKGKVVLLVGIATAKGSVEVKDVCFEEVANKDLICNRTAVKSVLSSVYSAEKRKDKDYEERFKVENLSVSQQTTLLNLEEEEVPEQCLAA